MADALGWLGGVRPPFDDVAAAFALLGGPIPGGALGVAVAFLEVAVNGFVHALVGWGVEDAGAFTLRRG
jgi:hypothetical protein